LKAQSKLDVPIYYLVTPENQFQKLLENSNLWKQTLSNSSTEGHHGKLCKANDALSSVGVVVSLVIIHGKHEN
jgi:hypothetical protein